MPQRWIRSNTSVYNIGYHLIWCPKYRRKVLIGDIERRLKELIFLITDENNWRIESLEIMPDHCHLFIKPTPDIAPQILIKRIKGMTSRILRSEFPKLKSRLPTLWTHSYYCESVGHISQDTIKKYIEDQKNK